MSYYHPENEPVEETSAYVQKEKESISENELQHCLKYIQKTKNLTCNINNRKYLNVVEPYSNRILPCTTSEHIYKTEIELLR